jgi:peroxiredoxin family protein
MNDKMSIIAFSGTEDKLMAAAIIASGAVANDLEVQVFVTFWGLTRTIKNGKTTPDLSFDGQKMKDKVFALMKQKNVPNWITMLKNAKEVGNIKVYGCAMFADLLEVKKEDLDPIVDDIIGVNEFVSLSKESMTFFI